MKSIRVIEIPGGQGTMEIYRSDNGILIERITTRSKLRNKISTYEFIDSTGESQLLPLTEKIAHQILDRISSGESYSSAFIFTNEVDPITLDMSLSEQEHQYTSTGIKFWRHQEQMLNYREGKPGSIISTHISPEGACNLRCPFCSVTYRDTHSRISLDVIQQYVEDLQTRGLKAVILTGGGESTLYKEFNKLVQWLKYDRGLSVALITNGTQGAKLEPKTMGAFSWVRVSINVFPEWEHKIALPIEHASSDCILGCSMVYTAEHEAIDEIFSDRIDILRKAALVADRIGARYVRLLPNCLLEQRELLLQHRALDKTLTKLGDPRFFHQHKVHGAPVAPICHQAYFRPYLSEEPWHATGEPGAVYPCDSVVLNDSYQFFAEEYQICHASDILKFLDREVEMRFDPRDRCSGCVFTKNVDMLHTWKEDGVNRFSEFSDPLRHEEFV
jgi:hypothetical protein